MYNTKYFRKIFDELVKCQIREVNFADQSDVRKIEKFLNFFTNNDFVWPDNKAKIL